VVEVALVLGRRGAVTTVRQKERASVVTLRPFKLLVCVTGLMSHQRQHGDRSSANSP
jgi:hypothetical protein